MAQFTLTNSGQINLPPSQIGNNNRSISFGTEIIFTRSDFTTNTIPPYQDPEGDQASQLKVLFTPDQGQLKLNEIVVIEQDVIDFIDIDNGLFKYTSNSQITIEHATDFIFDIADTGSTIFAGLQGIFQITIKGTRNLPPNQVGNGQDTIAYGETKIFTSADFTTNTTPAYTDPESDAPSRLKITSLPVSGTLYFNGLPVTLNQIMSFANIAAGLFTGVGDYSITTGSNTVFTFAIADSGSEIFVS